MRSKTRDHTQRLYTVKKGLAIFPSPAGMSITKLSLPARESLATRKSLPLFYRVSANVLEEGGGNVTVYVCDSRKGFLMCTRRSTVIEGFI
jgi:hypothetical protein